MKQKKLTARLQHDAFTTAATKLVVCPQVIPSSTVWQRLRTVILCFGLLFLTMTSARAATWYVDNAATGSNIGTSWANAWTAFSSIVWGSSGVKAGDKLYISGGTTSKTYTTALTVGASGTAGNPITIALDAANASHNGTVIFNTAGITLQKNYVTLDGNVNGVSHLVITNIYNAGDRVAAWAISDYSFGTTGVKIYYVTVARCNNGINLSGSTGYEIGHCLFTNILGDAAIMVIQSTGGFDANLIYSNRFYVPGWGADRIQCGNGNSIFGNYFSSSLSTGSEIRGQHPDTIQVAGQYNKIYNNDFVDGGDSDIDFSWSYAWGHYDHLWIYNNVFRTTSNRASYHTDAYPDYIRFYGDPGTKKPILTMQDVKICNNTFVDNPYYDAVHFYGYNGSPTASGNEIKNNLFYNCGPNSSTRALLISQSSGFTSESWSLDGNLYYYPGSAGAYLAVNGSVQTASSWIAAQEAHGKTNAPFFVRYAAYEADNDFHLASSDTAARNAGVNLSSYFTTDKDSNPRGTTWSIGAYEYGSGGSSTNPVISVSPGSLDFGLMAAGATNYLTFTVKNAGVGTLIGTSSVPTGAFSIISGAVYTLTSGQSSSVTVQFSPTVAGAINQTVTFTGGDGATAIVSGVAVSPPIPGSLTFEAEAGSVTAPFVVASGYIYQTSETSVTAGGRAIYNFTITNAGDYVIQATVNAPNDAANSLFVNIDAEPQDPSMTWQIPITTGFEARIVNAQGNGTFDHPQFVRKVFKLTIGPHQLIIRGREANTQLDRLTLMQLPASPIINGIIPGP